MRTFTGYQYEAHTEFSRVFSSDIVRSHEPIPPRCGTILGLIRPELLHIARNAFDATLLDRSSRWLARLTRRFDSTDLLIPSQALWIGDSQHEERWVHMAFHLLACDANQQVVDVVESLEAGGEPLSYFFGGDGHLNAKGHSLVANRFTAAVLSETHDCGS